MYGKWGVDANYPSVSWRDADDVFSTTYALGMSVRCVTTTNDD